MFIDEKDKWVAVDPEQSVADLKAGLKAQGDARHKHFRAGVSGSHDGSPLLVTRARRREVRCYPGWTLYAFEIDLHTLGGPEAYDKGEVYALINGQHVVLLDGTSPVIHALNASSWGEDGTSPLVLEDDEQHLEYLRFFCTFVAGEDGPFLVVEHKDDLESIKGNTDFDGLLAERRGQHWTPPPSQIPNHIVKALFKLRDDVEDIERRAKETPNTAPEHGELQEKLKSAQHEWDSTLEQLKTRFPEARPGGEAPQKTLPEIAAAIKPAVLMQRDSNGSKAEAYILYGRDLFTSKLKIDAAERRGMIEMESDEPIQSSLPIRTRKFHDSYPVLLLQGDRKKIAPEDFKRKLKRELKDEESSDTETNLLIDGDLNLKGFKIERRIDLDDVWINGDVILDDLRSPFSIHMSRTWIVGALHAKTLKCEGALVLSKVHVRGYYDLKKREFQNAGPANRVALSLRGADVKSELDLTQAEVYGGANLDEITVGGSARLSGIHIGKRGSPSPKETEVPYGLSAERADFKRDLDIGVHKEGGTDRFYTRGVPSSVVGGLKLKGVKVGGDIDLSSIASIHDFNTPRPGRDGTPIWPSKEERENLSALLDPHEKIAWSHKEGSLSEPIPGAIDVASATIKGSLRANSTVAHAILLGDAKVTASVKLNGAHLRGNLYATGAAIGGSLDCSPGSKDTRIDGAVDLSGAKIDSYAFFNRARLGQNFSRPEDSQALILSFATVKQSVMLNGAHLRGSLHAIGTTIGAFLDGDPHGPQITKIDGNVVLSGSTIGADTRFRSAWIGGHFVLFTGSLNRVQLRPTLTLGREGEECEPTRVGGISLSTARVTTLDFQNVRVERGDGRPGSGNIELHRVTVDGDLIFFRSRPDVALLYGLGNDEVEKAKKVLPDICSPRASIEGNLKAVSLIVGGEIDLTNLKVGEDGEDSGKIDLEGATCAKLTALGCIPEDDARKYDQVRDGDTKTSRTPCLHAKSLNLNHLRCTADADLSGICITGDVTARSAKVDGKLAFWSENAFARIGLQDPQAGNSATDAPGVLDLGLVRTPTLKISGDGLRKDSAPRDGKQPLKLDRAEVGNFRLTGQVPYAADLQNLKLAQLSTGDHKGDHTCCKEFLRKSWPFNLAVYRTIERSLRDAGDNRHADDIYRAMRWRSLRPEVAPSKSWSVDIAKRWAALAALFLRSALTLALALAILISAAWLILPQELVPWAFLLLVPVAMLGFSRGLGPPAQAVFIGGLTGFWTRSHLLLLCLVPTVLLSFLIFIIPENVAPTSRRMSETQQPLPRTAKPSAAEWTAVEIGRLVATIHVPVIPLIDGARWEPGENRNLCLPTLSYLRKIIVPDPAERGPATGQCPQGTWTVELISPAAYGLVLRALHWIAWPLFLIGVSGIIRRREGQ